MRLPGAKVHETLVSPPSTPAERILPPRSNITVPGRSLRDSAVSAYDTLVWVPARVCAGARHFPAPARFPLSPALTRGDRGRAAGKTRRRFYCCTDAALHRGCPSLSSPGLTIAITFSRATTRASDTVTGRSTDAKVSTTPSSNRFRFHACSLIALHRASDAAEQIMEAASSPAAVDQRTRISGLRWLARNQSRAKRAAARIYGLVPTRGNESVGAVRLRRVASRWQRQAGHTGPLGSSPRDHPLLAGAA
jgi:hypothetical protein